MVKKDAAKKAKLRAEKRQRNNEKQIKREIKETNKILNQHSVKKSGKGKSNKSDRIANEDDLIQTLEEYRLQWEKDHAVSEERVEGPPTRRANATLTACPNGHHLYLFGGEYYDGDACYFYNDFYRFSPDKNEWKRFFSPTCPGPRSAHAVATTPAAGGKLWLFGGEFSSTNQTAFHHYRDLWSLDIATLSWERFDTKTRPSARSGHRMAFFGTLLVLFGGFHDVGLRTTYLNDLWIFDTALIRWTQIQLRETDRKPSARSGFSFVACSEGIVLHGGYVKEYQGKKAIGRALDDTWLLQINSEDLALCKWQKRKRVGYVPSLRSGSTMTLWPAKSMAIMFGGVIDEEKSEETMTSIFFNDAYGYQLLKTGRWVSIQLRKAKKRTTKKAKRQAAARQQQQRHRGSGDEDDAMQEDNDPPSEDEDDPERSKPSPRYNVMMAVLKNTLFIYGGILESHNREYTLADFYTLALDKLDRYTCLRDDPLEAMDWHDSSDSEDDSGSDSDSSSADEPETLEGIADASALKLTALAKVLAEDSDSDEDDERAHDADGNMLLTAEEEEVAAVELRKKAIAFMGVSPTGQTEEAKLSTPRAGETLAVFYERSRDYWRMQAYERGDVEVRGRELYKAGYKIAQRRYLEYKPVLDEIERILEEAGLDDEEMAQTGGTTSNGLGVESRNRR
ncbi:uncharacterized protein L969DRAFT_47950 [Mixia osmundae IAM 14324]|uniref:DUF4110 domain-containing protein n=1 Tax=Mixia osmundae (strain CBS 9802 / IAM 14324 / JCM 22182 / KY 12970) TaxID=764103 RepID=G7E9Z5_MIXOS|nr:uncharacterized protein L969DRAFT_47950 [Mixia osmundae IAM 14324]KEI40098.1 hypothetical protein L969DRAFT_47950 [Mixia osmundae IAM 14324]GAA99464.1 hypothetical protein E5Q_06163 [Mixia osmundae IAM 14324]